MSELERELGRLLNRYSRENLSDTPDYLLAHFLMACLEAFETTVRLREIWWGRPEPPQHLASDAEVSEGAAA